MNVGQLRERLSEASRMMGYDARECPMGVRVLWGNLRALGKGLTPLYGPCIDEIQLIYSDESSLILKRSDGICSRTTVQMVLDEVAKLDDSRSVFLEYANGANLIHFADVDGLLLDDKAGEVYLHPWDLNQSGNTRDQDVSTWCFGSIRIVG